MRRDVISVISNDAVEMIEEKLRCDAGDVTLQAQVQDMMSARLRKKIARKRFMRVNEIIGIVQPSLSAVLRNLEAKSHVLIRVCRQQKWIWALLLMLVSIHSYFVRELLSALLLFTVLFVIVAFLVGLFVLIDHGFYSSLAWAESVARSFQVHHSFAMTVRVPNLVSRPAQGSQKLDHR
jgi:hypothetical protein